MHAELASRQPKMPSTRRRRRGPAKNSAGELAMSTEATTMASRPRHLPLTPSWSTLPLTAPAPAPRSVQAPASSRRQATTTSEISIDACGRATTNRKWRCPRKAVRPTDANSGTHRQPTSANASTKAPRRAPVAPTSTSELCERRDGSPFRTAKKTTTASPSSAKEKTKSQTQSVTECRRCPGKGGWLCRNRSSSSSSSLSSSTRLAPSSASR
mmetsp:Transcript_4299/g.16146  ORF Transcript_4299/g.16146 Transcript_4299/m.16146 type:complete len:213 (-) Transcript_4299:125-763(-)